MLWVIKPVSFKELYNQYYCMGEQTANIASRPTEAASLDSHAIQSSLEHKTVSGTDQNVINAFIL
jgi:hypothetical protein